MATRKQVRRESSDTLHKKESGTIKVFRSFSSSGEVMSEDEGVEDLEVREFKVDPAYISVNHGRTVNIGNFESVRVDVRVSIPCYKEEVVEAILYADNTSSDYLKDIVADYVEEIK